MRIEHLDELSDELQREVGSDEELAAFKCHQPLEYEVRETEGLPGGLVGSLCLTQGVQAGPLRSPWQRTEDICSAHLHLQQGQ